MKKLKNFLLYTNINKDRELEVANDVKSRISLRGGTAHICCNEDIDLAAKEKGIDLDSLDASIVLGGDGTLLRAAHTVGERYIPMIGVNLGTVGFLTEVDLPKVDEMVCRLMNGDYTIEKRMMLDGRVNDSNFTSLNDVVVARQGALRLLAFKIFVNDVFFDTYEADGIIVSTPTGSTGYNLSAGGPIVSPKASLILVTPVAPHSLSKKSVVFSAEDSIRIELVEKRKTQVNEALVSFDGFKNFEIGVNDKIEIRRSLNELELIKLDEESFYEVISRKFRI